MEFKNKQFDGPYEVSEIEIQNDGEKFRGLLYFPPDTFNKPYSLVVYFHGFPQLFPLIEIIKQYKFILDLGYALLVFNFRGYRNNEGTISITNNISDAIQIVRFIRIMIKNQIFDLKEIHMIGHDFGAYIALILCSKQKIINKLVLLSPIIDLKRHIYKEDFIKVLTYINHFLPGNIRGIENIKEFIEMTKHELSKKEFQINFVVKKLKVNSLKIIIGEIDKVTPISEIYQIFQNKNIIPDLTIIKCMDHECIDEKDNEEINIEITNFLKK